MLTDDKVFCSSTGGLFYYDLTDNSIQTISKADGLSDNGVHAMAWSEEMNLAVLAYENANVDILRENEIINIPDIFKKQIPGDKTIYHVYIFQRKAYLSCGFGIVVIDLDRYEIKETYYIGDNGTQLKVNQITSDGVFLYAATDAGLKWAELSNPFLIDFSSWEVMDGLPNPYGKYSCAEYFNGRLFVANIIPTTSSDLVYVLNGNWSLFTMSDAEVCNEIRISEDYLLFSGEQGVRVLSEDFIFVKSYEEGRPRSASYGEDGVLWIADYGSGLVRVEGNSEKTAIPDGPFSKIAFDMAAEKGYLYTVSGGVSASYNNLFRSAIFQVFYDQDWTSNISEDYRDLISLAIDPDDPQHIYAASWGYGLIEYEGHEVVNIYNESNSSLQNLIPGNPVVRIGGLVFDDESNLWMTNTGVSEPISVLKRDGTWKSFKAGGILSGFGALSKILISGEGHLWGIVPKSVGLFAANFNGTIENEEDDEYKLVRVVDENGGLITNEVYSFAEDLNGNIWLGTDQGIFVIYSPESLFSKGSVFAQNIVVPRNDGTGLGDPLLETQKITCIEVDGANRKWIGTADGGAFLVSESGLEQIHNFNTGNSPLLSNSITDICVEGVSGEVFFGTDKGIISFRGDATLGAEDYKNVRVYPNPVRESYHGPIAITGLLAETTVKITDMGGNLVKEIRSFGGQAIWDGTNYRGERAATGVYLIFLADRQPTSAHVTKLLFIH
jgi:hypothetical protein